MVLEIELQHAENTHPRADSDSRIHAAIQERTTIGPLIQVQKKSFLALVELKFRFHPPQTQSELSLPKRYAEERIATWMSYISENQDTIPRVLNYFWKDLLQKKVNFVLQSVGAIPHRGNSCQCSIRKKLFLSEKGNGMTPEGENSRTRIGFRLSTPRPAPKRVAYAAAATRHLWECIFRRQEIGAERWVNYWESRGQNWRNCTRCNLERWRANRQNSGSSGKLRSGSRTKSILEDLEKPKNSVIFSEEPSRIIHETGNIVLYELGQMTRTVQCHSCC